MALRYRAYLGGSKDFVERYFSSLEEDRDLARYVAEVMLVHVEALLNQGVVPRECGRRVSEALAEVVRSGGEALYRWVASRGLAFEDAFEALEAYLYEVTGSCAGYVAIGRSRNDHVASVLRLYTRDRVVEILRKLLELRRALLDKAERLRDVVMPYFTHSQVAQCGSASTYFLSYEKTFSNVWRLLAQGLELLRENPLGSGAASGSLLDIDRSYVARTLCLDSAPLPPYYATGSRLFTLHYLNVLVLVMLEVSRFAEDVILLNSLAPRAVLPPVEHVATSSIMPHKRNLVTMEIARARASKVLGYAVAAQSVYGGLPYGYNLDLQEVNTLLKRALETVSSTLDVVVDFVEGLSVDGDALLEYLADKPCWSSELVEYVAMRSGRPAREVYLEVARLFRECSVPQSRECASRVLSAFGLSLQKVWSIVRSKPVEADTGKLLEDARARLESDRRLLKELTDLIDGCRAELLGPVQG